MPTLRIAEELNDGTYFATFTVIEWIDIFTSDKYFEIISDALTYSREHKGLLLYAYVIMTNHVHAILSSKDGNLDGIIRDFKRHTTKEIKKHLLKDNRKYILRLIDNSFSKKKGQEFQVWQRENYPEIIETEKFMNQKINYIHVNPVAKGYVVNAEDWAYSSARNYYEGKGVIEIDEMEA